MAPKLKDLEDLHEGEPVLVERLKHSGRVAGKTGCLIRAPGSPHIGQGVYEVVSDHRGGNLLSPSQEVICHYPIVAAQVDRDYGALVDIARAGEPRHEAVIDGSVRIEEEESALTALSPVHDVLADEVLEEFRLAAPG
jgi:hypothetical protein